ncbi:Ribosomal protein S6 kinase alpha-4 [Phytophthora nicotianae]|uniref:Ribosomal protein S6 kinase alpha-4 n=1 Tax=Phytophthora nicotianae TaxID=4792 RepID=A0A0W8DF12_PHYNI|nr:Ribosomal protein S6 kinase alpha-4 [Phytophthora nicotianae]
MDLASALRGGLLSAKALVRTLELDVCVRCCLRFAGIEDSEVYAERRGGRIERSCDAKKAYLDQSEYDQIEKAVNDANNGAVEIVQVKSSTKDYFAGLQAGADSKKKTYWLNTRRFLEQWFTIFSAITSAVLTCYSRIHLNYHSIDQVVVGAAIGVLTGVVWYALVAATSPWLFPLVAESRLAKFFYVRDISHIPDLTVYQHEVCNNTAATSPKKKSQ